MTDFDVDGVAEAVTYLDAKSGLIVLKKSDHCMDEMQVDGVAFLIRIVAGECLELRSVSEHDDCGGSCALIGNLIFVLS